MKIAEAAVTDLGDHLKAIAKIKAKTQRAEGLR